MRRLVLVLVSTLLASLLDAPGGVAAPVEEARATITAPIGTVVSHSVLPLDLWIPGARKAFRLKYVTTDAFGRRAYSTGEVFVPKGRMPAGGWPVLSWAHGTSGIGDTCAPSRIGPALKARDFAYLGTWIKQGYAIVASDYAGLGTPGLHAYLDGRPAAHNIVDMVKAGRRFARAHLPAGQQLARKWVALGQSQGGGAAIYTARYASRFGGSSLDYRGAVGTGTPAYIEDYLMLPGPDVTPVPTLKGLTAYLAYILAGLRYAHPELGIDGVLTADGKRVVKAADTECANAFEEDMADQTIGDWFTAPLATLPNWRATVVSYLGMPEHGFDRPFFMGHGMQDTDVPFALTARYAAVLTANGEPVEFHAYPTGTHNTTLQLSLPDSLPFVRRLFR